MESVILLQGSPAATPPAVAPIDTVLLVLLPYIGAGLFVLSLCKLLVGSKSMNEVARDMEAPSRVAGTVILALGIYTFIIGHIFAMFIPSSILVWNASPTRLSWLELSGIVLAFAMLVGVLALIGRVITDTEFKAKLKPLDFAFLALMVVVIALGVHVASEVRWISSIYATSVAPYVRSMILFNPDVNALAAVLPTSAKLYFAASILLMGMLPTARLSRSILKFG